MKVKAQIFERFQLLQEGNLCAWLFVMKLEGRIADCHELSKGLW